MKFVYIYFKSYEICVISSYQSYHILAAVSFLSDHTFNPRLEEGRMAVHVKDCSSKLQRRNLNELWNWGFSFFPSFTQRVFGEGMNRTEQFPSAIFKKPSGVCRVRFSEEAGAGFQQLRVVKLAPTVALHLFTASPFEVKVPCCVQNSTKQSIPAVFL